MYLANNIIYYGCLRVHGFKGLSKIFVARTKTGICYIQLSGKQEQAFKKSLEVRFNRKVLKDNTAFGDIMNALTEYFARKQHPPSPFPSIKRGLRGVLRGDKGVCIPLDLSMGTPFHQRVWRKLIEIPYGKVRTYKWVAEGIGLPKGVRATGQACGSNPIPIIIPCHRVIQADGGLGGYSSGVALKGQLLKLEGVMW